MNKKNIIYSIFLLYAIVLGNGCATPREKDLVTSPPSYMIKKEPVNASVAVLSWNDQREYIKKSSIGIVFIPLVPFGRSMQQSKLGDTEARNFYQLKPLERYQMLNVVRTPGHSWGACEEYTVPRVIEDYLNKTATFKTVYFSMSEETGNYKKADYLIRGTLFRWSYRRTASLYGLGPPGVVIVSLFYIPWQFSSYEIDFMLEFVDNKSDKTLYSQRYFSKISARPKTFPFLFGAIGYPKGNFTSQNLKPFIEYSLENFVSNIQNIVSETAATQKSDYNP